MEKDVFEKVYKEYLGYVYRYLYSLTFNHQKAEDLTQDVFVKAFCVLDFPHAGIKAWLLTVAHNLYVDYIRKYKRIDYPSDEVLSQYPTLDIQDVVAEKDAVSRVFEHFKALPEAQRQAVLLCLVNELTYTEAAQIMGLSVPAVANLIYRARQTLREMRRKEE